MSLRGDCRATTRLITQQVKRPVVKPDNLSSVPQDLDGGWREPTPTYICRVVKGIQRRERAHLGRESCSSLWSCCCVGSGWVLDWDRLEEREVRMSGFVTGRLELLCAEIWKQGDESGTFECVKFKVLPGHLSDQPSDLLSGLGERSG